MNSKLFKGHSTTGYRFTQVTTTVLGHIPWTKEKEDENVRARVQSSEKESNTGPLYPDLLGKKATRFYGYQCMYGQHLMLSRFCKQMLSVRINFPFIHCFMPSKNGAGVLRDQQFLDKQFSPVCVFGPLLPSNCFFFFFFFLGGLFFFFCSLFFLSGFFFMFFSN